MEKLNSYDLSRNWFDFCFENPELISPNHSAIYFFAIEHCNRLGWKEKFGFPTQMAMDAIGIKKHQTYIKYFEDLCKWGFFKLIQKSKNQYSSNIISLINAIPKNGKALDKAIIKHEAKQTESNGQSNSSILKQETIKQGTKKQDFDFSFVANNFSECFMNWIEYKNEIKDQYQSQKSIKACYNNLLKLSGGSVKKANAIVEQSIANGWRGLFEFKGKIEDVKTDIFELSFEPKYFDIPNDELFGYPNDILLERCKQGIYKRI